MALFNSYVSLPKGRYPMFGVFWPNPSERDQGIMKPRALRHKNPLVVWHGETVGSVGWCWSMCWYTVMFHSLTVKLRKRSKEYAENASAMFRKNDHRSNLEAATAYPPFKQTCVICIYLYWRVARTQHSYRPSWHQFAILIPNHVKPRLLTALRLVLRIKSMVLSGLSRAHIGRANVNPLSGLFGRPW